MVNTFVVPNLPENNNQQWKKRVDVFRYVYSFLVEQADVKKIISDAKDKYIFDKIQLDTISYIANNLTEIKNIIISKLSSAWTIDRVKPILLAILITAYAENIIAKTPKKVVIDQAIINAKNYSDETDYKFINAILDKIIK